MLEKRSEGQMGLSEKQAEVPQSRLEKMERREKRGKRNRLRPKSS